MKLAIYGAYGFTGRLIGKELTASGHFPILAGRDPVRLSNMTGGWCADLEKRVVDPENHRELADFLAGIDLLIQCAGPYVSLPEIFLDTLNRWPGIVLDVCGEFSHVENSFRQAGEIVRQAGGLRIQSCGFESLPALWLASEMMERMPAANRLCTFYKHRNPKFSPGTRATARLMSGERRMIFDENTLRLAHREEWISEALVPWGFPGDTALLSPLPEMAMLPRRYGLRYCGSYAVIPVEAARFLEKNSAGETPVQPEGMRRPRSMPTPDEQRRHAFTLAVSAWSPDGIRRTGRMHGQNPYGTSAWMVRRLVEILAHTQSRPSGIRAPDELFPAKTGLAELMKNKEFRIEFDEDSRSFEKT